MDACGGTGECEMPSILTVVTFCESSDAIEVLLVAPGDLGLLPLTTLSALLTAFKIWILSALPEEKKIGEKEQAAR